MNVIIKAIALIENLADLGSMSVIGIFRQLHRMLNICVNAFKYRPDMHGSPGVSISSGLALVNIAQ